MELRAATASAGPNGLKVVFANVALELKEQLTRTLAAFVTSILAWAHRRLDAEEAAGPLLR
jgi:hypothetical protein